MGGSATKLKRMISGEYEDVADSENCLKKFATPFIYTRKGSMYFDQDGDLAHEFYEEMPSHRRGIRTKMKQILEGLTPQGEILLPFPCLNSDFPIILYQES